MSLKQAQLCLDHALTYLGTMNESEDVDILRMYITDAINSLDEGKTRGIRSGRELSWSHSIGVSKEASEKFKKQYLKLCELRKRVGIFDVPDFDSLIIMSAKMSETVNRYMLKDTPFSFKVGKEDENYSGDLNYSFDIINNLFYLQDYITLEEVKVLSSVPNIPDLYYSNKVLICARCADTIIEQGKIDEKFCVPIFMTECGVPVGYYFNRLDCNEPVDKYYIGTVKQK